MKNDENESKLLRAKNYSVSPSSIVKVSNVKELSIERSPRGVNHFAPKPEIKVKDGKFYSPIRQKLPHLSNVTSAKLKTPFLGIKLQKIDSQK